MCFQRTVAQPANRAMDERQCSRAMVSSIAAICRCTRLTACNGRIITRNSIMRPFGSENLIRPCEQDEWIEALECVNSTLAMSGDVAAAQTRDPTLGRTR